MTGRNSLFLLKHLLPVITIVFERVDEVKNYQLGGNQIKLSCFPLSEFPPPPLRFLYFFSLFTFFLKVFEKKKFQIGV